MFACECVWMSKSAKWVDMRVDVWIWTCLVWISGIFTNWKMFHNFKDLFRARCDWTKGFSSWLFYPSSFLIVCHIISSLLSLQTPEDTAFSAHKHETVKLLKEYAKVCGSVVLKGCVLNLDVFSSHSQSVALCLVLITTSLPFSLSFSHFFGCESLSFFMQVDIKEPECD